jgi:hypothetical protein
MPLPSPAAITRYGKWRSGTYGLLPPVVPSPSPAPGVDANYTYTVGTLAELPAGNSVTNGTIFFVESQRSYYRSDLAGNTYRRMPIADASWQLVTSWEISPTGNIEASGAPGFPIPFEEFVTRLPKPTQSITIAVVAGAAMGRMIWQMGCDPTVAAVTVTIAGVRTLGGDLTVATSSDETATLAPRVDAGAALTIGKLVQVTTGVTAGATAYVVALIAGTNYETTPWRSAAGSRVAPPALNDTIAVVTLPSVAFWGITEFGNITVNADNFNVTSLGDRVSDFQRFRTSTFVGAFAGAVSFRGVSFSTISGCGFAQGASFFAPVFVEFTGFVQSAAFTECVFGARSGQGTLDNSVCHGRGIIVRDGGCVNFSRVGVMSSTQPALQVIRTGLLRVTGTYYGSLNATGTVVDDGGVMLIDGAVTPTCAAGANELLIDGEANQVPALGVGGGAGAVAAAAACNTFAAFKAAPFSGNVSGRLKGSRVLTT